jgi:hypothetical protein
MLADLKFLNTTYLNYSYYERPFIWLTKTKMNGWTFEPSFLFGYKIPILIDNKYETDNEYNKFLGGKLYNNFSVILGIISRLKMELTHYNDSKMSDNGWGSDFINLDLSPVLIFELPCNITTTIGVDWTNGKSYTTDSIGNGDFRKREYKDWYINLDSIFLSIGWKF